MASLLVLPSFDFELPSSSAVQDSHCGCVRRRLGPFRTRYQPRHRWSPFEVSSRLFEFLNDESFGDRHLNKSESSPAAKSESNQPIERKEDTSNNFSVSVDLGKMFSPEEISVRLVDRSLMIEGKHEEKGEDGEFTSRQFTRSHYLSKDIDIEKLRSTLSEDGVLRIVAPKLEQKALEPVERNIPIQQGEAVATASDNMMKEDDEGKKDEGHREKSAEDREQTDSK